MTLTVRFWGTRGSIPSPGAQTVRYGGNTPCVELRTPEGLLVVLDAGTGIRELGRSLIDRANGQPIRGDIFLTHAHWDHIQGLPFFAPVFQEGNHFTIWGSKSMETSLSRVVRDQMSPVVFPVAFDQLAATIDVKELSDRVSLHKAFDVRAFPVQHPGGALGYRFAALTNGNEPQRALVYISDNELRQTEHYESLVAFCKGASVLVHDSMFTVEEYRQHVGWGHSTYDDAVELALEAEVERLVLFHHKPERTDDEVDRRTDECRALVARRGGTLEILAAAEGLTLKV
ncbi:MAG TPA: MBL fold metallo-hydrolase [Gemmatimonadaceae bacterium]|jgi:phosphoribosyl 1,2-cyclic phosphodiesterase|nr:MBL fold metallo-hydrolase [Gemmatimonadaceae bacterium]